MCGGAEGALKPENPHSTDLLEEDLQREAKQVGGESRGSKTSQSCNDSPSPLKEGQHRKGPWELKETVAVLEGVREERGNASECGLTPRVLIFVDLTDGLGILMWNFRLLDVQDAALFLSVTLYVCHLAGAISIYSPQRSLTRSIQEDVLFSVNVTCQGIPTIQWTFMSGVVSRSIGTWQAGVYTNITEDYRDRVQTYANGSMGLSVLRLQDGGFYVVTITETTGSSRDAGFVLKVNEVIYEDLQYLSVSFLVLACLAGLGMLTMWLLDKTYRRILAWTRQRANRPQEQENEATELQPL